MPFCHKCGAQNEPEANYCEECGSRLATVGPPVSSSTPPTVPAPPGVPPAAVFSGDAGPPAPPVPAQLAGPPSPQGVPWRLVGGLLLVAVVIGGIVAVYLTMSGGDDKNGGLLGGGQKVETVAAPSPTAEATAKQDATPKPTVSRKATPTPKKAPTATPAEEIQPLAVRQGAQVKAIAVFIEGYGEQYAGDCEKTNVETDAGMYCSKLWEDRGDSAIYVVGLSFSEFDTWMLLEQVDGDWVVSDWAQVTGGEMVPPW